MFKYQYLPNQSQDCIETAEYIFARLKEQGVTTLPNSLEEAQKFVFCFEEGQREDACVFFVLEKEHVGFFQKTVATVHGTAQYDSAKFLYAN